jgi:tetratricopeptide (TPR) repeat protein
MGLHRYGDAQRELLEILKSNPGDFEARRLLAEILLFARDGKNAEILLAPVVEKERKSIDYFRRAQARAMQGNNDLALKDTTDAIAKDPRFMGAYFLKTYLLVRMGRGTEVPSLAREMRKRYVGTSLGFFQAAGLMQMTGDRAQALQVLDEGLRKQPGPDLWLYRTRLRGNTDEAVEDARSAVKQDPTSAETLRSAAHALLVIRRYPEASELVDQLERQSGNSIDTLNLRGIVLWIMGDHDAAISKFVEARAKATDAKQLNRLCWDKARYATALDEALLDCDGALALKPDDSATLDSRAFVLMRKGQLKEAVQAYDESLRVSPRAASYYGRGLAMKQMGDTTAANMDIELAMILSPWIAESFRDYALDLEYTPNPSR